MGLSDYKKDRTILDWPDDVVELADALGIDKFPIEGISGGGPYAAACAYKIPDRLTACGIISGLGPMDLEV
jgi:pimeloyl-ACP methyl ester carboxylesterase